MARVTVADHGRVRVLTLDRPEVLNAVDEAMFLELADVFGSAAADDGVAVVVVTGAGRAFCAGMEMGAMREPAPLARLGEFVEALTGFPKPLVAAVNGVGVGVGMTMLAHFDLVLMASNARLRAPFAQLGLTAEVGSSVLFPERMGWQDAMWVLASGRWFDAEECRRIGLVWRVCPPDRLLDEAMDVAGELAAQPLVSLLATKRLLLAGGRPRRVMEAHEREMAEFTTLLGGPANAEAVAAFERRSQRSQ